MDNHTNNTPLGPRFSLIEIFFLLSIFGLPILINPAVALSFDEVYLYPKILWIYVVVLPSALLVLWHYREALHGSQGLLILVVAWVGWLVLSTLLNGAGWLGWWGASDRADGVLMHLTYVTLLLAGFVWTRSEGDAPYLFERAVLLGGSLLALSNVLQQVGLLGVPGDGAISGVAATMFGGTLGHRGYLGGALALLLPVVVAYLNRKPQESWAWLAVAMMTWAWVGSFTRGTWLAGGLGLIWLAVWSRPRISFRTWSAVALGLLLCVETSSLRGETRSFSLTANSQAQAIGDTSGRTVLWNSALFGLQQRPLFGWGSPALWRVMHVQADRDLLSSVGVKVQAKVNRLPSEPTKAPRFVTKDADIKDRLSIFNVNKIHNEYLEYALTYGFPSTVLFISLIVMSIRSSRVSSLAISAGLVSYAVYLLTWPEIIRFAPVAWFMMGIALVGCVGRRGKFQP